jgi:hypothetical protein
MKIDCECSVWHERALLAGGASRFDEPAACRHSSLLEIRDKVAPDHVRSASDRVAAVPLERRIAGHQRVTRYICDPRLSAIFDLQAHHPGVTAEPSNPKKEQLPWH